MSNLKSITDAPLPCLCRISHAPILHCGHSSYTISNSLFDISAASILHLRRTKAAAMLLAKRNLAECR